MLALESEEKISKLVDDGCKVQKPRSAEVETIASVSG